MLYVQYPQWLKPEIIPGFPVRWYGLMYLLAFFTCYIFTYVQLKKEKSTQVLLPQLSNVFFWAIIGLLIGARIVSEVVYSKNIGILLQPWLLFWPFDSNMNFTGIQGMSYHGGLIGSITAVLLYCRIKRLPTWILCDRITIGASLGYGFGRLGNFANGELFGRITASPIGMIFSHAEKLPYGDERVKAIADAVHITPDSLGMVNLPRHPSQLYETALESIATFIILFIIYKLTYKKKSYIPGMFIPLYIMLYSIARFIVEYFRQPDVGLDFVASFSTISNPRWLLATPWNFTTGQVFSFVLICISICILISMGIYHKRKKKIII